MNAVTWLYTISGFGVGALVGVTGVGGGSLMTPLLILLFGMHPATAVGTDLLYAAATKSGGVAVHQLNRTIDWRVVGRLASGSAPTTVLTLLALSRLDLNGAAGATLITTALGVALLLTAGALIFRPYLLVLRSRWGELDERRAALLTVATGAVLGVLVSITSVGAGALGVTALFMLYPRLSTARIVGSDIAHAVPLTVIAGIGHWWLSAIDWHLLEFLLLGSLPGIVIGSYFSVRLPDLVLRATLAATLILVGGRLVF